MTILYLLIIEAVNINYFRADAVTAVFCFISVTCDESQTRSVRHSLTYELHLMPLLPVDRAYR